MPYGGSWRIGDVSVTAIVESDASWKWRWLLPDVDTAVVDDVAWLRPDWGDDERFHIRIQGFLVESEGRRILVDTCVGNDKERPSPLFDRLSTTFIDDLDARCRLDDIDLVVCTHLHVDHVGWNTRLRDGRWVPTFERARHLFARAEYEHWANETDGLAAAVQADSVEPVVRAGLVDLVEPDHELTDEVRLESTPGHTPGHVSVRISSLGQEAVITGDMTHHPVQLARPGLCSSADVDPTASEATRRRSFARWSEDEALVIGSHYVAPTGVRLEPDGDGWRPV